jgi:hypothetical protein
LELGELRALGSRLREKILVYKNNQQERTFSSRRGSWGISRQQRQQPKQEQRSPSEHRYFGTDLQVGTPVATENAASDENGESIENVGQMIQDLAHSDNAKVNAALDALLSLSLEIDKQKYGTVTAWGGCAALVHLLKDRLKKATKKIPQCDQVKSQGWTSCPNWKL